MTSTESESTEDWPGIEEVHGLTGADLDKTVLLISGPFHQG